MNETRDLGEGESDLGDSSFSELGRNSVFIEVMVIVLLIIHCFISLQILGRHKINDCNILQYNLILSASCKVTQIMMV